jgi:arylsulfatase A-like enzyme
MIKDPRIQETSGMQTEAWVEYVDIYPTLAELCGLSIPQYLEGTSMVPLLYNPTLKWKSAAFSQFPRGKNLEGYAIRTNRFRYIEWWNKNKDTDQLKSIRLKELYDHEIDPEESVNVAANPEYKNWVSELELKLKAGWKEALPEGFQNLSNNPKAPPAVSFKKSKKNR